MSITVSSSAGALTLLSTFALLACSEARAGGGSPVLHRFPKPMAVRPLPFFIPVQTRGFGSGPPPSSLPNLGMDTIPLLDRLMRAGDDAMIRGDISRARGFYERAASVDPNSPFPCLSMGSTYDPNTLSALDTHGSGLIDVSKAREWYERARVLGHPAAERLVSRLR